MNINENNLKNSIADKYKDFISNCDSIKKLVNLDDDDENNNIISPVNSNYHDIKSLNSLNMDLPSSFGLLHVNIASLENHIDDFRLTLSLLKYRFDIIGISEHKIREGSQPSKNIDIPGYYEFNFEPTGTTHGGTGFYIKNNIDYIRRPDLQFNSPSHYESMFIEIKFPQKRNLIIGCIYRHPQSNISIQEFTTLHLDPVLQNISQDNKQCVIMGDFNVNLLKTDVN